MRLSIIALSLLLTGCSFGDPNYVGAWDFQTSVYGDVAQPRYMQGTLIVTRKGDSFDCNLQTIETAFNRLPGLRVGEIAKTDAQQTCQLFENKGNITIQSRVINSSSKNYQPDNFDLNLDGDKMEGHFSSNNTTKVSFIRKGSGLNLPPLNNPFAGLIIASQQSDKWLDMGKTVDGCQYAQKTPVQFTSNPAGIKVWLRFECGGTLDDGRSYTSYEDQSWFICDESRSYTMARIYLDSKKDAVKRWVPTMYGFEIPVEKVRAEGFQSTIHQSNTILSNVARFYCD